MRIFCKRLLCLGAMWLSSAAADDDWRTPQFELSMALNKLGWQLSPKNAQQSLATYKKLLATTPVDVIESEMSMRSNVETGFLEFAATFSEFGAHDQALEVLKALDERVPTSQDHAEIVAAEAKLLLRLRKTDDALALARTVREKICDRDCSVEIRRWLDDGSLPTPATVAPLKHAWVYDERGTSCTNNGYENDKLADFDRIDLVESNSGARAAAAEQLATMWSDVVIGCVISVEQQRLHRLLHSWTNDDLRAQMDAAQAAIEASPTQVLTLIGASLSLPDTQCDFSADASCNTTVPLSAQSARYVIDKLRPLDAAWSAPVKKSAVDAAHWNATEALGDRYSSEMDKAADMPAEEGLVAMKQILARPEYAHLGMRIDGYHLKRGLEKWSRQGHADEALAVYTSAMALADDEENPAQDIGLALLQMRAGKKVEALASVERANTSHPSEATSKALEQMRAAAAGADIAARYPVEPPSRPWKQHRGYPICDFFGGATWDIPTADIIAAYQDKRRAALWSLQQEWRGVLARCYDGNVWKKTRSDLRFAFSRDELEIAKSTARASAAAEHPTSIAFLGIQLPLPDLIEADEDTFKPITPQDSARMLDESGLLDVPNS